MKNGTAQTLWNKIMFYFKGYPNWLVQFAVAWSFAFFLGFILRSFGKFVIFSAIAIGSSIFILTHFNLATFDIIRIKELLGISNIFNFKLFLNFLMEFPKNNIPATIGAFIGFMFGWSLGK